MQSSPSRLMVLMFTDVVGSMHLKTKFGAPAYAGLIARHDELFRNAMNEAGGTGAELLQDTGDGHYASFPTASAAVRCALRFQYDLSVEAWPGEPLEVRVGIHLGEMAEVRPGNAEGHAPKLAGLAVDLAARVMSLAQGGQILLTRFPFNDARQFIAEHPPIVGPSPTLKWIAHGPYLFKGVDEAIEIFEVGAEGIAPLKVPPGSEKARRVVAHDLEETLGWRPAVGLAIPDRPGWVLDHKLGEGGFGEVWLGRHAKLHEHRVFKFCFDPDRLRSFKREMTLFRLLRDALGDRPDIAKLHEVKLDESPFFLESEYTEGGNLTDWAQSKGGIDKVKLATRLDLVARIADAVAAAHSVGILHKDIKPSNILIYEDEEAGEPRPVLSDFGIGMLADRGQLLARNITEAGFTDITLENDSSRTGTRMYAPPESLTGKPFTVQGDVYALGILLYQMEVGDLTRPLGAGWERYVADDLVKEDIAACVDGDPSRRLAGAAELAARVRTLDSRRTRRRLEADAITRAKRRRARNKFLAVTSVVILVLMITVTILVTIYIHNLRRTNALIQLANDDIARQKSRVEQSLSFFEKILQNAGKGNGGGQEVTVEQALDRTAGDIDKNFSSDADARLRLHDIVGDVYFRIGVIPEAKKHLEEAYKLTQTHPELDPLEVGNCELMLALTSGGEDEEKAIPLFNKAIAHFELAGPRGATGAMDARSQMADYQKNISAIPTSQPTEANGLDETILNKDFYLRGKLYLMGRESGLGYDEVVREIQQLRSDVSAADRRGDQLGVHRAIMRAIAPWIKSDYFLSQASDGVREFAQDICGLGDNYFGEILWRETVAIADELYGPNDAKSSRQRVIYAMHLIERRKLLEAEELLRSAIATVELYKSADPRNPMVLSAKSYLAELCCARGDYFEGAHYYSDALTGFQLSTGENSEETINSQINYSSALSKIGRLQESGQLIGDAFHRSEKTFGKRADLTIRAGVHYVSVERSMGRANAIEPTAKQNYEQARLGLGAGSPATFDALKEYAYTLADQSRLKEADELMVTGLQVSRKMGSTEEALFFERQHRYYQAKQSGWTTPSSQPATTQSVQ